MSKYSVYRDKDGNPVTITEEQCAAIRHAARTWAKVTRDSGYSAAGWIEELSDMLNGANVSKSCLLNRMLYQGKDPLDDPPPTVMSAPAYYLTDPDLCKYCGREKSEPGGTLAGTIKMPIELRETYERVYGEASLGKTHTTVRCNEDWHPR